jgi:arabinose-5-phosphate isomerase
MITNGDVVLCLSKSGSTPEIKILVPLIRSLGNHIIAIVGNMDSYLAIHADFVLDATVEREACPNNLAPTASTTAQLALGDALAVALLTCRGFSTADFAKFHPGGALGKKLYLRVDDLFRHNEKPELNPTDDMPKVILEISSKRLGAAAVTKDGRIIGVITDGDLRRMLGKYDSIQHLRAEEVMSVNPRTIDAEATAVEALEIMRNNSITQLLVTQNDLYLGVIHLHDILKEGII